MVHMVVAYGGNRSAGLSCCYTQNKLTLFRRRRAAQNESDDGKMCTRSATVRWNRRHRCKKQKIPHLKNYSLELPTSKKTIPHFNTQHTAHRSTDTQQIVDPRTDLSQIHVAVAQALYVYTEINADREGDTHTRALTERE